MKLYVSFDSYILVSYDASSRRMHARVRTGIGGSGSGPSENTVVTMQPDPNSLPAGRHMHKALEAFELKLYLLTASPQGVPMPQVRQLNTAIPKGNNLQESVAYNSPASIAFYKTCSIETQRWLTSCSIGLAGLLRRLRPSHWLRV